MEFLREIAHLRPRSNVFGSLLRVRSEASFAVHQFFRDRDFFQVHTPILTTNDCEGAAGELFQVTANTAASNPSAVATGGRGAHYFGQPTYLTVSGQLHAEIAVCALAKVYTFGPTFRAEDSNTRRHLSEFWMVEAEQAFVGSVGELSEVVEENVRFVTKQVLARCPSEINLFNQWVCHL